MLAYVSDQSSLIAHARTKAGGDGFKRIDGKKDRQERLIRELTEQLISAQNRYPEEVSNRREVEGYRIIATLK
ncbi:hypothetical protein ABTM64_20875, partial [Acinetobacter baumannii]